MGLQKLLERIGLVGGRQGEVAVRAVQQAEPASEDLSDGGPVPDATIPAAVEAALERGDAVGAVDLLAEANRRNPSGGLEMALVDLRHAAAGLLSPAERAPWPPSYADPFPGLVGEPPSIDARDLGVEVLGGAVAYHGCLVVRDLFTGAQISAALEAIRNAEARRSAPGSETSADRWYRPFPSANAADRGLRQMVARHGGTWLADSPASCARVLDDLAASGAIDAIAAHFGDRPLISLQKSTLRRSAPVFNFAGWHQDGSFLGPEVRAMNVWVALTPCGGDRRTPGMELVPRRVDEILPTDGGLGSASISDATVLRAAQGTPRIHPAFEAGDAMLFDERFLHRTHLTPDMEDERYALECWFFAPAHSSDRYVSFLV